MSLNKELFKELVPTTLKDSVTDDFIDHFNNITTNDLLLEQYKQTIITYTSVLNNGKYKIRDYMNACVYVTHKLMGSTNKEAYIKTFPDRYERLVDIGAIDDINQYVKGFSKGTLVNSVLKATLTPNYILYADLHTDALMHSVHLMHNSKSETVQQKACATVLEYTKQPEKLDVAHHVQIENTSKIDEYENALRAFAQNKMKMIADGADVIDVTNLYVKDDDEQD